MLQTGFESTCGDNWSKNFTSGIVCSLWPADANLAGGSRTLCFREIAKIFHKVLDDAVG